MCQGQICPYLPTITFFREKLLKEFFLMWFCFYLYVICRIFSVFVWFFQIFISVRSKICRFYYWLSFLSFLSDLFSSLPSRNNKILNQNVRRFAAGISSYHLCIFFKFQRLCFIQINAKHSTKNSHYFPQLYCSKTFRIVCSWTFFRLLFYRFDSYANLLFIFHLMLLFTY